MRQLKIGKKKVEEGVKLSHFLKVPRESKIASTALLLLPTNCTDSCLGFFCITETAARVIATFVCNVICSATNE